MLKGNVLFGAGICALGILGVWLWLGGGADRIALWAAAEQRDVQNGLARALRAVRGGDPAAWGGLLGLCFAYGFFHAAGPGHGKLVMGGYALGVDVSRARLIMLTLAGSLGQAVTAVVLVYAGIFVLGWGREQLTGIADGALALVSAVAIVGVGLWLCWRGVARWRRARALVVPTHAHSHNHSHSHSHEGHDHAGHAHDHSHDGHCETCGHAHGPSVKQVAELRGWGDAIGLVLSIAIRPCTGALFVLILTYGMGIWAAGIAGAFVMAIGTSVLTVLVALGAGMTRSGLASRLDGPAGLRAMAGVEVLAGLGVVVISSQVALRLV